jgi:FKBP-type peptidyl-prolyl cis-trans isomerase SlyD
MGGVLESDLGAAAWAPQLTAAHAAKMTSSKVLGKHFIAFSVAPLSSHTGGAAGTLPAQDAKSPRSGPPFATLASAAFRTWDSIVSIKQDSVVTFYYTLKDDADEVIDSSSPGEPLAYLHGHGNLVPGLERELEGKSAGDKLSVKVTPAAGYGEFSKDLIQKVPRRSLKGISKITVGMRLHAQTEQGPRAVTVTNVMGDMVTIDGNHPLAGKNLNFDIEIVAVREPTEEELAHGHVHGPGGHH